MGVKKNQRDLDWYLDLDSSTPAARRACPAYPACVHAPLSIFTLRRCVGARARRVCAADFSSIRSIQYSTLRDKGIEAETAGSKVVHAVWAGLFGPASAERSITIVRSIPEIMKFRCKRSAIVYRDRRIFDENCKCRRGGLGL